MDAGEEVSPILYVFKHSTMLIKHSAISATRMGSRALVVINYARSAPFRFVEMVILTSERRQVFDLNL